jgi:ABC-2 type transport system ATP-binding protein
MNNSPYSVEVSNLTVRFKNFVAVDHIQFKVKRGEIFGFLGANGAGKTTTIRVLCGLLIPTEGEVHIAGYDLKTQVEPIKSSVGYMSQKFTLYNDLTIQENLEFKASLRKLDPTYSKKRIQELFEFIDFNYSTSVLVRELPAGIKQQLSLAASILHDPEIIFLDEPTAGVNPVVRIKFWNLIQKLSQAQKTIFVTTHYMDEAEQCHRIALMRSGRIVALDTPENLKKIAFPHSIFEVSVLAATTPPSTWITDLKQLSSIESLQPFGRRYHLVVKNLEEFETQIAPFRSFLNLNLIPPALEDVFVHFSEGTSI